MAGLKEVGSWNLTSSAPNYGQLSKLGGQLAQLTSPLGDCEARFKEVHNEQKKATQNTVKETEKS